MLDQGVVESSCARSRVLEESGTELSLMVRLEQIPLCSVHVIVGSKLSPQCRYWRLGGVGGRRPRHQMVSRPAGVAERGAASAAWAVRWSAGSLCAAPGT